MLAFGKRGKFVGTLVFRAGNMQRHVTKSNQQKRCIREPEARDSQIVSKREKLENVDTAESHCSTDSDARKLRYSEKKGDLFTCESNVSLAHCVSADMVMGKGIAVLFKKKFGGVDELKRQRKTVGEVAVLKRENRFVYYLVTKSRYSHKPTYDTLQKSLLAMKCHCVENNVSDLAMPQIGCGLDRLQWNNVSQMIKDTFKDLDMTITVYYL